MINKNFFYSKKLRYLPNQIRTNTSMLLSVFNNNNNNNGNP